MLGLLTHRAHKYIVSYFLRIKHVIIMWMHYYYRHNPPRWKRYLEMYSALLSVQGGSEGAIDIYAINIRRIMRTFQRDDRITYLIYLHRYRETLRLLHELGEELTPKEQKKLGKIKRRTESVMGITPEWLAHGYQLTVENLTHYIFTSIQNDYHDVLNYTWNLDVSPSALLEQLSLLEASAIDKARGKDLPVREGRILVNFPDGYYWVMLNVGQCELEGKAMAHCGNVADDDYQRILSLRKDVGGKTKAHLTFIWHQVPYPGEASIPWPSAPQATQGYLGETKGYANNKPSVKYHPHIIELLKLPMIQYNLGGGYQSQNNFHLSDLTMQQQETLRQEKPQLFGLKEFNDVYGMATTTIFLSRLTGINDAPLRERTPHLPIAEISGEEVVVLMDETNPHPFPGSTFLITRLGHLKYETFATALEEIIEWADNRTSCSNKEGEWTSVVHKTSDIGEMGDYDDLPHMPNWIDIHFEKYLLWLREHHPESFRFFMSNFDVEDIGDVADVIRENPKAYIGEEYYDLLKIFLPAEEAGVRLRYLHHLQHLISSTGCVLELDIEKQGLISYISFKRFLEISSHKLDNPDTWPGLDDVELFTGKLPSVGVPKKPVVGPPTQESLECFWFIIDDVHREYLKEKTRQRRGMASEDYDKWLRDDDEEIRQQERDSGYYPHSKEEDYDIDEDEDEEDLDDDIDLWS